MKSRKMKLTSVLSRFINWVEPIINRLQSNQKITFRYFHVAELSVSLVLKEKGLPEASEASKKTRENEN